MTFSSDYFFIIEKKVRDVTTVPTFADINYFIEVAETSNISRAAERLGITQPSLSLAMKRLEDSVGTQLILRSRKGVQLTKAGNEFLIRGRLFVMNWEQIRADVINKKSEVVGQYVLGCHSSVALYSLSTFLPRVVKNYPGLSFKLVHDLSRKITEGVISFEIDFGIVVNPVQHLDLVIKELCRDEVQFWTLKKPSATQKLDTSESVLICDLDLVQVQKMISELNKKGIQFSRVIHSSNLEVIAELTAQGVGVGILPKRVANRGRESRLKSMTDQMPSFKDVICLIYRADFQKNKASQILIDEIKKSVK